MTPTISYPPRPGAGLTRRSFLGRAGTAAAAGVGAVLLPSCGGGGAGSGGSDAVTFLNIVPLESLTFTPELVASAGGHFANEGLDVSFQVTRGSAQAIQTVIAESALLTRVGNIETVLAAGPRDAPVINVGMPCKESTIRFVSAARAPIQSAQEFRGKTIGIPSEGGTSETTLDLILSAAGIAPSTVPRQVVGLAPGVFNLVRQGRLDAYVVSIDTAAALERQRPDAVVFNPADAIDAGGQIYLTSQAALDSERDRDLLQRYLRAVRSAMEFVIADESLDETVRVLKSEYDFPPLDTPEVAKDSLRIYVDNWTANGRENLLRTVPQNWTRVYQEMVEAQLVPTGLQPQSWFTNELVKA